MLNLSPSLPLITLLLLYLLYSISFILESLLLFATHFFYIKTFPTQNFRSVVSHPFNSIFENLPSKSTIKASEWFDWHCSGVFIDVGIENLFEHLRWSFFAKIVNREKLNILTGL